MVSEVGRIDQGLLELLASRLRHHGELGREALDVLRFLHEEALGDEQREVRVDVPGCLEQPVETLLDPLPERVAARPDDHAALDRRVVGQLRVADDVDVPRREILGLRRDLLDQRLLVVRHDSCSRDDAPATPAGPTLDETGILPPPWTATSAPAAPVHVNVNPPGSPRYRITVGGGRRSRASMPCWPRAASRAGRSW